MVKNNNGTVLRKIYHFGLKPEAYTFIENLSGLLDAGMDMITALDSLKRETRSFRMKNILGRMAEKVEGGSSLSKCLEQEYLFSERMISLLRLGEQSGKLVENLKVLALQNEKDQLFKSKVRSSLMYASIVFTLTLLVGAGTIWYILPKLAGVFNEMQVDLPLVTRAMIQVGAFIAEYGYFAIPAILGSIFILFYFLFSFPKTKFVGHSILFRIPLVKQLIMDVEIARFGFLLGTMMEAGVPITEALGSIPGTTTFRNYQNFYYHIDTQVQDGDSFKKSIESYKKANALFPISVQQMIIAGEQSGNLSETLKKIGQRYEQKTEQISRDLPIIMEPIIFLIIGLGVATLALGVILPFYQLVEII